MKIINICDLNIYINDDEIGPRKGIIVVADNIKDKTKMMFESVKDTMILGFNITKVYSCIKSGAEYKDFTFRLPNDYETQEYIKIVTGEPFKRFAIPGFKICGNTKCRQMKLTSEFNKCNKNNDGLKNYCRDCQKLDNKRYIEENKEEVRIRNKNRYYNDLEKSRRKSRESAEKRRDKIHECHRVWYEENKEYKLEKNREWYRSNPERRRESGRNKARKRREKLRGFGHYFTKEMEKFILQHFDNKCFNCGKEDKLTIDHHNPLSKGNPLTIDNAVVLCINCNSSKGIKDPNNFYTMEKIDKIKEIIKKIKASWETTNGCL